MGATRASKSLPRCSTLSAVPGAARGGDIAHRNGALERGREAAAGDFADVIAFTIEYQRTLSHRLAPIDVEADALLRRLALKLGEDAHRAGEAAFGTAALVDGEGQAGHHRCGVEV